MKVKLSITIKTIISEREKSQRLGNTLTIILMIIHIYLDTQLDDGSGIPELTVRIFIHNTYITYVYNT